MMALHKLSLTDDELRRLLHAVRLIGYANHNIDLETEVAAFGEHTRQFGPKHEAKSLHNKLLGAAR